MRFDAKGTAVALAAVAAAGLGGAALAGAAGNSATGTAAQPAPQAPHGYGGGRHVGSNGQREKALSADVAAKVEAAALAEYPGATIERVETDADHGSPYEAHLTTKAGKHLEVLVDASFKVTGANEMGRP
jgi:hypothetical protein